MFVFVRSGSVVFLSIAALSSAAQSQRAGTTGRDSVGNAAAALVNEGRVNEARMTLMQAMRAKPSPAQLATYRLELGDTFLYDGQYGQASRTYNAVLSGHDSISVDSLIRWAHHGLALIDVFNGRPARAAVHYAQALEGRGSLGDTIEMLVLTSQHDSALNALDRYEASHSEQSAKQFVQSFRGLSWLMAGHCTQALPQIAKAPRQDGVLPTAVRGRCAMKHGQRVDALALRDSVMTLQVPDPFAWYVFIARDVVRKIQ
ncbi:MAG TPA: hypothetical protein VJO33_15535 [Gemmatimonadaceae bacterium]|nr:hypothetical protein [Gemmatimonadaceae bacterium]